MCPTSTKAPRFYQSPGWGLWGKARGFDLQKEKFVSTIWENDGNSATSAKCFGRSPFTKPHLDPWFQLSRGDVTCFDQEKPSSPPGMTLNQSNTWVIKCPHGSHHHHEWYMGKIMATIRWCPIYPKWDIYQSLVYACQTNSHLIILVGLWVG